MGPKALYEYELFAIISHEGTIDNGHYTSYAKYDNEVCPSLSRERMS